MTVEPSFRLAAESDTAALLKFMEAYYAFDGHGFDEQKAGAALTTLLRDSNLGRVWLILDGEAPVGYVVIFHEKAGRSQVVSSLASLHKVLFSRRVAAVAMLPSALSRSDWFRSVHVGRSRFSRCCHLFGALSSALFRVEPGPGH